jgi:hypothetical protein
MSATAGVESLPTEPAEAMPLHLPSSLPRDLQLRLEMSSVLEKERRLREAQADDALTDIQHQRQIISGLWQFKKMKVDGTGNKPCTHMRTLYNHFHLRMRWCATRYHAAR